MMDKEKVMELFRKWCLTIETCDVESVLKLYDKDAILLPTLSKQVCYHTGLIRNYFNDFLEKKPVCRLINSYSRIYAQGSLASHSGLYTFSLANHTDVPARFTFLYEQIGHQNLIVEHHSSVLPQ